MSFTCEVCKEKYPTRLPVYGKCVACGRTFCERCNDHTFEDWIVCEECSRKVRQKLGTSLFETVGLRLNEFMIKLIANSEHKWINIYYILDYNVGGIVELQVDLSDTTSEAILKALRIEDFQECFNGEFKVQGDNEERVVVIVSEGVSYTPKLNVTLDLA